MKGLNEEPGWRQAWVTWLNLLRLKSKPPTRARIAPSCGSSEMKQPRPRAAARSASLAVALHPDDGALADAPLRRRLRSSARAANCSPGPAMTMRSPLRRPPAPACRRRRAPRRRAGRRCPGGRRARPPRPRRSGSPAARHRLPVRDSRRAGRTRARPGAGRRRRLPGPPCAGGIDAKAARVDLVRVVLASACRTISAANSACTEYSATPGRGARSGAFSASSYCVASM